MVVMLSHLAPAVLIPKFRRESICPSPILMCFTALFLNREYIFWVSFFNECKFRFSEHQNKTQKNKNEARDSTCKILISLALQLSWLTCLP